MELDLPKIPKTGNNRGGGTRWGHTIERQFRDALAKVEKEKGVSLLVHAIRQAYDNDKIMVRFLDKLLPTLTDDSNVNLIGGLALGDLSNSSNEDLQEAIIQLLSIKAGGNLLPSKRTKYKKVS